MAKMDYAKDAQTLVHALGGKSNINRAFHCMTRIRVYVKKRNLIDEETIKSLPEVTGINWNSDQFQIICGTYVEGMYDELVNLGVPNDDTDTSTQVTDDKNKSVFTKIVDAIAGCMTPIIPALTAAGMIKVVLALVTTFKWVSTTSTTYQVINFSADAMYYFLPFFIAASASKVFRVNQSLAILIAGVFLHPTFTKLIAGKAPILFFGLPVFKYDYSYSVIPIILMVWLMSYITKFAKKITPDVVRLILEPTIIIIISVPLALLVVGPIGGVLGNWLAIAINFLSKHLGFIIVGILAAAFPYIVMTGMHHALTPIGLNAIATGGDTLIFLSQVCSNIAQGGSALAVGLRSKDKNMKQLGTATGISALMGITEPALYGVNLKLKRPLLAATIAAGIGGLVGGLLQVTLYIPQNCLLALPAFIGGKNPMRNFIFGVIMMLVSFILSFILTLVLGFEDDGKHKAVVATANNASTSTTTNTQTQNSSANVESVEVVKPASLVAPISGDVKDITEVPDKTFAEKSMGDGVAIQPSEGKVYAPADGQVVSIMNTKHGVMLKTNKGTDLLIHIGLDTVNLKGKYFTAHVKNGDKVSQGDLLIEFDMQKIKEEGYNLITPIVILNTPDYDKITHIDAKEVKHGDILLNLA